MGVLILIGCSIAAFLLIRKEMQNSKVYSKNPINRTPQKQPNQKITLNITKIEETGTSYEHIGHEERIIDNSRNNGSIKRKLTIFREWSRTINIENSISDRVLIKAGISPVIANLSVTLEKTLQEKYSISSNEKKTFSEEIELDILPYSKILLTIDWKTVWRNGIIELTDDRHNILYLPYKVVSGLTFDQIQEKVN